MIVFSEEADNKMEKRPGEICLNRGFLTQQKRRQV